MDCLIEFEDRKLCPSWKLWGMRVRTSPPFKNSFDFRISVISSYFYTNSNGKIWISNRFRIGKFSWDGTIRRNDDVCMTVMSVHDEAYFISIFFMLSIFIGGSRIERSLNFSSRMHVFGEKLQSSRLIDDLSKWAGPCFGNILCTL